MKLKRIAHGDCLQGDVRVRGYRQSGKWIGRVHVIRRPLTDYLRFELAAYRYNVAAGEDVRILDVTDRPNPGLPDQDFWMFDETNKPGRHADRT
ncbi:DUF6879 family protein [Fodinicola acaciae]|uniref:DUF6879 family protein n=1 Tax=Fodinicola acaciae TaxID=2681555 RepID=UPI001651F150|nr:DUF6879 family protein [Fodinicola acaciae]